MSLVLQMVADSLSFSISHSTQDETYQMIDHTYILEIGCTKNIISFITSFDI